jgi:hypothetical protein
MGTDGQTDKQTDRRTDGQIFTQYSGISSHSLRGVRIRLFFGFSLVSKLFGEAHPIDELSRGSAFAARIWIFLKLVKYEQLVRCVVW